MSLAKKLLGINHLKKLGHPNILQKLDETLLAKRQLFGIRKARKAAKSLIDALDGGDRGEYLIAFAALAEIMYAPEANRSGRVHPSRLATDCERRMYFEMTDVEPEEGGGIEAKLQRIFDVGTWYHTYIQILLVKAQLVEGIEVRVESKDLDIDGRADAVTVVLEGKKYLVEIKSCNSNTFRQVSAKHKALDHHVNQASTYAAILGIEWLVFLYINKDTSEILQIFTETDMKSFKDGEKKIKDVQLAIKKGEAPERICNTKHTTRAMGCEYCNWCFNVD
jgi:hypothetical protein